ncbi:hypothetical protein [Maribacter sp. LLG6340-A2]|uniref:hypothetical protein n=1 Tax=Maribacter sp. LLG6340-A2 TaxID=3160834 RepID=UPI003869C358
MNSRNELLGRTLDAFPVNLLKDYFDESGKKEDIIEAIVQKFTEKDISDFICTHFNFLHLTINVFELNKKIPSSVSKIMDGECIYFHSSKLISEWIYLHKIFVNYYDTKKGHTDRLEFLIPVKIFNRGKKLIVYQNTFQRNINSYFEYNIFLERGAGYIGVIDNIRHNYAGPVFSLDLNKGIKYLWTNNFLDAMHVKSRQSKSIRQDRMDENYLYKASYPKRWKQLMSTPIQQTKFKSLTSDISLDHFDCNPSTGNIGVSFHPNSPDETPDLINLILRNN